VAPGGRVFAVDPSIGLLEVARSATRDAGVGHLVDCRVADGHRLPFGLAAFDAAVCHWVLLHVDRPDEVIAEMKRVTRRGGRILAVEMDWETLMIQPGDRALTRRILQHAADRSLDPWIGRRLPRLFAAAGLADVAVHPIVMVDQGREDRAWFEFARGRSEIALNAGIITRDEFAAWNESLESAFRSGSFFLAVAQFAVIGRVPG
jgi:SAM-dependent methyltransferase